MDEGQFERLIQTLAESNTGANQRAVEDRAATARSVTSLATAISRGGDSRERTPHRFDYRGDTLNTVLKTEREAMAWAKENPFDPVKNSADIWGTDMSEKLISVNSQDVIKYAGYESYIRQSNEMYALQLKTDKLLIEVMEHSYTQSWGHAACQDEMFPDIPGQAQPDASEHQLDAVNHFIDGSRRQPGPKAIALRKMAMRQIEGFVYSPVRVVYDWETFDNAARLGTDGAYELDPGSKWKGTFESILRWIYDRDSACRDDGARLLDFPELAEVTGAGSGRIAAASQPKKMLATYMARDSRRKIDLLTLYHHACGFLRRVWCVPL